MKKRIILLSLAALLVLSMSALAGCGKKDDKGDVAGGEKQVVVAISSEPTSLDEEQISDYNSDRVASELYDTLVRFKDGSLEIEPCLAESWDISADGLTYTFKLRKDVKFHDGTEFNADAVKFNYDRIKDPNSEFYDTGVWAYADVVFDPTIVEGVKVVDPFTVQFNLKTPYAPFINNMAMTQFSIASPTAVAKYGKEYSNNPVGTGAFKFVSWTQGSEVTLEKNADYFGGAPKIDKLIYRFIKDDNVRLNEFEAGSVDFIVDILPDSLMGLKDNPDNTVLEQPGMHTWYVSLNCLVAPFDKVENRQALYYAIDRQSIVDNILQGTSTLANNLMPPTIPSYSDDVPKYEYNPEKAKELLKSAGNPEGFSVDFYVPESGSGMQQADAMAAAIQSDLAKVGIKLNIQKMEWGAYLDKMFQAPDKQDMLMGEMSWLSDNGDPDNFLYVLAGGKSQFPTAGFNSAYYNNDALNKILVEARGELDQAKRDTLYAEAQKIVMTEVPYLVVDHENQIVAMKNKIEGFKLSPRGFFRFAKVDVK